MPAARAAAHVPRKLKCVVPPPGVNSDQVSLSPWIKRRSPPGDQVKEWTGLPSKSWRGNPASLTIHNPPGFPSDPLVAKASQPLRALGAPVVNRTVWSRPSWLPSISRAAVLTATWYVVLGARSSDGAMVARRPSAGSTRTSNGMLGLNVSAERKLFAFISRVKLSVMYAAGSTPVSLSDGVEAARFGGPSVTNDQWWRSEYVLPARSR